MNAHQFARHRLQIERQARGRHKWERRALAHLISEARAVLVVRDRRVVGYRLPSGETVCVKRRYSTEEAAGADLARIGAAPGDYIKPVRAYHCQHCLGLHLTSQAIGAVV